MKLALVTGGAKGIGRAIASRLLDDGMEVAVVDCIEPSALDSRVRFFKGDVTRAEDLQDLAAGLLSLGGVDVLVNNAGIRGPTAPVSAYPLKDWEAVVKLNLTGPFLCCQLLTAPMQEKRWGRIINIASMQDAVSAAIRVRSQQMGLDRVDFDSGRRVRQLRHHSQRSLSGARGE